MVAGTMKSKLSKRAIMDSNIVDYAAEVQQSNKISLRISSVLLYGLVVIHERKTSYVYSDVNDILIKVRKTFQPNLKKQPKLIDVTKARANYNFEDIPIELDELVSEASIPGSVIRFTPRSSSTGPRSRTRTDAIERSLGSPFVNSSFNMFDTQGTPVHTPSSVLALEIDGITGIDSDLFGINGLESLPNVNDPLPSFFGGVPLEFPEEANQVASPNNTTSTTHEEIPDEATIEPRRKQRKRRAAGEEATELSNEMLRTWLTNTKKICAPLKKVCQIKHSDVHIFEPFFCPLALRTHYVVCLEQSVQDVHLHHRTSSFSNIPQVDDVEAMRAMSNPNTPNISNLLNTPRGSHRSFSDYSTAPSSSLNFPCHEDYLADNFDLVQNKFDLDIPIDDSVSLSTLDGSLDAHAHQFYAHLIDILPPQGDVFVEVVSGTTKFQVAKSFSQLLILASKSLVNVSQSEPYANILINLL
ncbi:hypothetical protein P9112_005739 [Eukaryota sp. TZLM1-RC]